MSALGPAVIVGFTLVFALLVISQARSTSATYDETTHLSSGYSYLRWDDYRLNPEHPPLLKKLAALFVLNRHPWPPSVDASEPELTPKAASDSLTEVRRAWALALEQIDSQWTFGHYFLYGPKPEVIQRVGIQHPLQLPTTARFDAKDFLNDADQLLFQARLATLTLGVLLAVLVFLWARDLWGLGGAVLAIALFCFDPNFIAHSGLVTTDVGVTAFIFGAVFFLWKTCRRIDLSNASLMCLFVGLAFASKFTSILLIPMFALAALGRVLSNEPWPIGAGERKLATGSARALVMVGLSVAALASGYAVVWASYSFRYSAAKDPAQAALAESWAVPHATVGAGATTEVPPTPTRWREPGYFPIEYVVRRTAAIQSILKTKPAGAPDVEIDAAIDGAPLGAGGGFLLFAQRHKLLPEAYLYGLAEARMKSLVRNSFLRGQSSNRGFRTYSLWAFLLKTPLITLAAIIAGLAFAIRRHEPWRSRMAFLLVPVIVYWGVSMGSSLNIGHRHLLPIYPFLYVLAGGLALEWTKLRPRIRPRLAYLSVGAVALAGSVVFAPPWRPAVVFPHYLAYFNELAGGPRNGYRNLVDSNLDWGQDLRQLRTWIDRHHLTQPIYLCYFGMADPRYYGIEHVSVPRVLGGFPMEPSPYQALESQGQLKEAIDQFGRDLLHGAYIAISATNQAGVYAPPPVRGIWERVVKQSVLVDQIGYSMFIYRIGPPER